MGAVVRLRRETVSTRYQTMARDLIREVARLGDVTASSGFDVLTGRDAVIDATTTTTPLEASRTVTRMRARMRRLRMADTTNNRPTPPPPLQTGLFAVRRPARASKYGTVTGNAELRAMWTQAEQTKYRAFDAAVSLCSVAVSIRQFHRALLLCQEQVRRHCAAVMRDGRQRPTVDAETWIDMVRMVLQTECLQYLHEFVVGVVPLLLCTDVTNADQRSAFRRSVAHSLWCISEQMQVFH